MICIVDIGSNSIRTMTAERTETGFGFSRKAVYTTRLAAGLDETGLLAESSVLATLAVLSQARAEATQAAAEMFPYATSAVRDANNREAFLLRAKEALGTPVRVLSGGEEARYAYLGASHGEGALIDIGGGSAQIVTAAGGESFPIGCVRAKDCAARFSKEHPSLSPAALWQAQKDAVSAWVNARTQNLHAKADRWTGVGGTITTLAALSLGLTEYDPVQVNSAILTRESLLWQIEQMYAMGEARQKHPLLTQRHDVIVWGALVLSFLMDRLSIPALGVSDADGMEGYASEILLR